MATLSDAREQQHRLQRFWAAQSRHFTAWFLALPSAGQLVVIRAAAPDMREASPAEGEPTKATDVLVPELTQSGLLSDGGRGLIRLYAQRVNLGVGGADAFDVMMLMKLHAQARMPCFAGEALNGLALSWVDPADPEEKICGLREGSAAEEVLAEKRKAMLSGKLVDAEVWTTKRMRQATLNSFLLAVADTFESEFTRTTQNAGTAAVGCRVCGVAIRGNGAALLACPCGAAFYCSKDHQASDWPQHKADCKRLRRAAAQAVKKTQQK